MVFPASGKVASVVQSGLQYHFVFDANPGFKSAFALPGGYIIVGGGLLALTQTEDELANALGHEIAHVELGQVSRRVSELTKQKEIKNLEVFQFFPSYSKEEELACDLNGQKLAAKAGYSPVGALTLLETFKALGKGKPEEPSDKHPTLSERIAQAGPLAKASPQDQKTIEDSLMVDWYNAAMSTLTAVLAQLEQERAQITSQLAALSSALAVLNGSTSNGTTRRKTMSPAARARIAVAQRARWARAKKSKVVSISTEKKRHKMSAAALAKIRAGQKKRWAVWRKSNKKSA